MKSLFLSPRTGELLFRQLVQPLPGAGTGVIAVSASAISSGTERATSTLAASSLASKARARPDLVRQVVDRALRVGLAETISTVQSRLSEDLPVGYSGAGTVLSVGTGVNGVLAGDRVVTAGSGHSDFQVVSGNLMAKLPDGVPFQDGALAAIAAVGLHGLRLAEVGAGSRVLIIGLGLIGQLTARIALASGLEVAGLDVDSWKVDLAVDSGVLRIESDSTDAIEDWTQGSGVDATLITAATPSSEPVQQAADAAADRGRIVAVGDVGLEIDRRSFYEKELTLKVSRSYGAGRYDPSYEGLAVDYPHSYTPFTIKRNLETVVNLLASGRLAVSDLLTHRFDFDNAPEAYEVFDGEAPYLGILLEYAGDKTPARSSVTFGDRSIDATSALSAGLIGAGRFATQTVVPAATAAGFGPWTLVASSGGVSAAKVGEQHGFQQAVSDPSYVTEDEATRVVFIATHHDSHASHTIAGLRDGKHLFCEKPLAVTEAELEDVIEAYAEGSSVLMVGHNRRWSPAVRQATSHVGTSSPIHIVYRVHAGDLPDDHWLKDRRQGGRLIGEGCHFVDTCNAITGELPRSVFAAASGKDELLLDDDFTITLTYPSGSQAVIVYSAGAPRGAGKEHIEIMRGDRSAEIDDYRRLILRTATKTDSVRFKPADKGHQRELVVFRQAIEGKHDANELAATAFTTMRTVFAAVESLMTGQVVYPLFTSGTPATMLLESDL